MSAFRKSQIQSVRYDSHKSRIFAMEKMKISSETGYKRSRVINGYGPHKMLDMLHQELSEKLAKRKDQIQDLVDEIILSNHKSKEVKK
jgi:hypothetical protein